jgi:hypothetical protein
LVRIASILNRENRMSLIKVKRWSPSPPPPGTDPPAPLP